MASPARFAALFLALATPDASSQPSWLKDSEQLTYALSYFHVVAGNLVLAAEAKGDTVRLSMTATSTPGFAKIFTVEDRIESVLSRDPLSLLRQEASIAEGKRRYREELVVDPVHRIATRTRDGQERSRIAVPLPVLDTLGAIFALRALDLAPGRAFLMDVVSGKEVYPLTVVVTGRQTLKIGGAKVETFVVEPRFRGGGLYKNESRLLLYVTQDPRHTPLRIVSRLPFGSLTATLLQATPDWQEVVHLKGEHEE
ncbi:MAG: DUF3108 domain-containing protein [Thermoanaerobaculum sp.]